MVFRPLRQITYQTMPSHHKIINVSLICCMYWMALQVVTDLLWILSQYHIYKLLTKTYNSLIILSIIKTLHPFYKPGFTLDPLDFYVNQFKNRAQNP